MPSNHAQIGSKFNFYRCDTKIWQMTSKNNRKPPPCPLKLCVSFRSHLIIWIGVINRKRSSQIVCFSPCVTLKFDGWPWKTMWHLYYPFSSYFVTICKFVNSNWRYDPEKPQLGHNLIWRLWPWPLNLDLIFSMDVTLVHVYNSC